MPGAYSHGSLVWAQHSASLKPKCLTSTSDSGLGSTKVTARTRPPSRDFQPWCALYPWVMPELKQRKQKLGKATGSMNDDSVSRRCRRRILLGQGPCALAKCFASTETRRHDVGRPAELAVFWCLDKTFWAGRRRARFTDASRRSPPKRGRLHVVGQAGRGALHEDCVSPLPSKCPWAFVGRGVFLVQPTRRAWAVSLCEP